MVCFMPLKLDKFNLIPRVLFLSLSKKENRGDLGNEVEIHSNNVVLGGLSLTLSTLSLKSMDEEDNDDDDDSFHENINVTIFPHNSALKRRIGA